MDGQLDRIVEPFELLGIEFVVDGERFVLYSVVKPVEEEIVGGIAVLVGYHKLKAKRVSDVIPYVERDCAREVGDIEVGDFVIFLGRPCNPPEFVVYGV